MMRKKPPCKKNGLDCPRRTLTCHGVCKEFKEWKAELDAQNLEKQKENDRYSNPDRPRRYKNIIERIK